MPKNIVNDILPPDKRTIRNIPIPEGRKIRLTKIAEPRVSVVQEESLPDEVMEGPQNSTPRNERKALRMRDESVYPEEASYGKATRRNSRFGIWVLAGICLIALLFAVSSIFEHATVKLYPKQVIVPVSGTFTANREGQEGVLPFEVITVERDGSTNVAASAEQHVDKKASGNIVVYNNSSANPQTLIANTRFESGNGLVYRIQKPITVPGVSMKNGEKIPGSLEVTVFADKTGDTYNIAPSDFKIPGFKGDPRYETIFARSKTPMTGGFSGTMKTIADDTLANAKDEITSNLKEQLKKDVEAQIPLNFSFFDQGLVYTFEDKPQTPVDANSVTINVHGTLHAIIFDKNIFGKMLGTKFIPDFAGGQIEIENMKDLTFALISPDGFNPAHPDSATSFNFTLEGNANLVWQYDANALMADLAGVNKKDVNKVLEKYPSVNEATVTVRPFWKLSLPKDPKKITINKVISN